MKVLVFGAELPKVDSPHLEAANLRTQQIVTALLDAGHELHLLSWHLNGHPSSGVTTGANRLKNTSLDFSRVGWIRQVNQIERSFAPDCVVGIMWRGAMRATRLHRRTPLWMDLYGDIPAEGQISSFVHRSDRAAWSSSWKEHEMLARGDVFSTCSERQRHATIGRLGLLKRLNASTCGYEFVHCIPPGVSPDETDPAIDTKTTDLVLKTELGSQTVPRGAVVALWSGSYNNWTDVETLFHGVTGAMGRCESLHYVSTGGGVVGSVYDQFRSMVSDSPFKQRFHLFGWQPYSLVRKLHSRADIGISVDGRHYETLLGTRTRLVAMASAGLAIISSRGCELVELLEQQQALRTFEAGNSAKLTAVLLSLAQSPSERLRLAGMARRIVREQYSFAATTVPLLEWVKQPQHAPDSKPEGFGLTWADRARLATQEFLWRTLGLVR